jgi:hypothetical protein
MNTITIANMALPVMVGALTATLFFMFRPADCTALFYLNLGYTVWLEVVFFGYIHLLYRGIPRTSTPFLALFGIFSLFYVVAGGVWMVGYSLALAWVLPLKVHVAVLIVLTLTWIVVSVLTARSDSNYKATVDVLDDRRRTLEYYTRRITLLASRHEKLREERGIPHETHSNNRTPLDRLKVKIGFLTPNVLNSETTRSRLDEMLDKCEALIEETALAPEDALQEREKKMTRFVNNAIDEVEMMKHATRG